MDGLSLSEDVLRRYLAHGDSVLLANLIHITRHFFHSLPHHLDLARKSFTDDDLFRQPASYLLCMIPDHHLYSTPTIRRPAASQQAGPVKPRQLPLPSSPSHHLVYLIPSHTVKVITQGIADTTPISFMFQPIAQSHSNTDDIQRPDEEIIVGSVILTLP